MKKLGLLMMLLLLSRIALFCQAQTAGIEEKEVLRNEDVIFHQIDEHTWFGTGHLMANESLYLVEGETKAILIDAGTKIKDLDKLVASITDKPVTLVATHVHPDHTGSAIDYFPETSLSTKVVDPGVCPGVKTTSRVRPPKSRISPSVRKQTLPL